MQVPFSDFGTDYIYYYISLLWIWDTSDLGLHHYSKWYSNRKEFWGDDL